MPVLSKLVSEGSATWSATSLRPALRLPLMASLITGLPVERHGITWNTFEFSRGYPRAPTVFDYLDLSGGRDSAIFFMDESLYQLAKPEPYTDYQMCGPLRPECNPAKLISYVKDYFKKATSGHGHGHAILSLPHFLVIHLPAAGRAASRTAGSGTTVAAAVSARPRARRRAAILTGARFAHRQRAAHEELTVEALDGFLGRRAVGVLDERESPGPTRLPVEGTDDLRGRADLGKVGAQVVFGGLIRQIADEQSD